MCQVYYNGSVQHDKSTLNDILRSEEKFKVEKKELGLTKVAKTNKKVEEAGLTSWTAPFISGFVSNVRRSVQ